MAPKPTNETGHITAPKPVQSEP